MEKTLLKAMERNEKPNKVRNAGFIPGVLNGPGTASTSVKFETAALRKIILKHGSNAKVWVELGAEKKFGFIKDIQKQPVDGNIIHVSIQLVSEDQEVKMQLPIAYHGHNDLEHRQLQLQVYKSEVEVSGKPVLLPDSLIVDVSAKEAGDNITAVDFGLSPEIRVLDPEQEIYAVIKTKEVIEEPEDESKEEPNPAE